MTKTNLYLAQIVGVTEEQWFENGYHSSPLIRSKKTYHLHQTLYAFPDAETAYQRIKEWVDGDSDCNHDGEGDLTRFYNLGIHEIELLSSSLEDLSEDLPKQAKDYGFSFGTFNITDVDENGIPLIRKKQDLEIFRRPQVRI